MCKNRLQFRVAKVEVVYCNRKIEHKYKKYLCNQLFLNYFKKNYQKREK